MQSCVDQINCGADESYQVAEVGQPMVTSKCAFVGSVLGVLFFELGVRFFLAAQADLVPQAMLLLHLPHLEHYLCGRWAKPLGVQTCHDQCHKIQNHLQDKQR